MNLEAVVQTACMEALVAYCGKNNLRFNPYVPYANQQGEDGNAYCADLIGVLDNSSLLLLEMKELEGDILPGFRVDQHQTLLDLERKQIPIAYCYNEVHARKLPNIEKRDESWSDLTLASLRRSVPSGLPNEKPHIKKHPTLLDWLCATRNQEGGDAFHIFGNILKTSIEPHLFRNWFLLLIYDPTQDSIYQLTNEQLKETYNWLVRLSNNPTQQQVTSKLQKLQKAAGINPSPPSSPSPTRSSSFGPSGP